ncbi:MAG: hypothetical protein ACUVTL_07705 [Thermoproteota archaeon]
MRIPMMLIREALCPIEQLPGWMQMIARAMPLAYAVTSLRKVMVLGSTFGSDK